MLSNSPVLRFSAGVCKPTILRYVLSLQMRCVAKSWAYDPEGVLVEDCGANSLVYGECGSPAGGIAHLQECIRCGEPPLRRLHRGACLYGNPRRESGLKLLRQPHTLE
jgi:hypothetical protein